MATKAELEAAHRQCLGMVSEIDRRVVLRDHSGAIGVAVSSLSAVHASVTYQRRFVPSFPASVPTVDRLLWYAPCFFQARLIGLAERFYEAGTKAERRALPEMGMKLSAAHALLRRCDDLWQTMSQRPDSTVAADSRFPTDPSVFKLWVAAGLIYPTAPDPESGYAKVTDFTRVATGQCSRCGALRHAPTPDLVRPTRCAGCGHATEFALVSRRREG